MSDIVERLRLHKWYEAEEAADEIERLRKEIVLRKAQQSREPFCPDHRDKVRGLPCRECEIERLRQEKSELETGWQRTYDHDVNLLKTEIERLKKDVIHWREARRTCIEAADMKIAELQKKAGQRGARMQIMREFLNHIWWGAFVEQRPEVADWFDENGVPQ